MEIMKIAQTACDKTINQQADEMKRMGRDSNPRYGHPYSSFQDCRLSPLGHPSYDQAPNLTKSSAGCQRECVDAPVKS